MDDRVYLLEIGGRPTLCFPAVSQQEAQTLLKEEWLRADLREMRSGGKPLWDGREKLHVRNADGAEASRFQREAKALPADEADLPIVYLVNLY
jgi:hypothetical protein